MKTQNNRSIEQLTQAIELNPTDTNAHFYRGYAYHIKGNYDKAIADYTKAIRLKPNLAEAYNNRGAAHSKKDDYNRAIKDLNKAIQLKPNLAKAYNNRGAAHGRKGKYSKAIADLNQATQLNPKLVEVYNNRGAIYINRGNYGEAIEDLNKAIQLDPNFAVAYYNRGIAYANKGDDNRANADFTKEKELKNWNVKIENLINQLRNLASQPSIDQSALNTCESTYSRLMKMHQTLELSEQIIQEIDGYRQKFMDERQKLIDRERFSNLSAKAMNPNVATSFPQPQLDENDIKLVGKWCQPQRHNLDRVSIIEAQSKEKRELGRLLSARAAEKVAMSFYWHYGKEVKDISITQIDQNSKSEWEKYDLDVDELPIDVKNSRRSRKNPERYTEHCVPRFKHSRKDQDVKIAGVFSPYLWPYTLLEPTKYNGDTTTRFLGQTTWKDLQALKDEFSNLADFGETNPTGIHFLPPWVFDYPEDVYTDRDKALKELKEFPNLDSLKGATFEFNSLSVSIAAGIDLTEILGNKASEEWEQHFLNQLRNRIEKYGLSLPFLFLTILEHFLCMAASSKTVSNFEPDGYRRFLFYEEFDKPLGIYDPLKTVDSLIKALDTLWTAENGLIRKFCQFKLRSFNILWGKTNPNENLWTTLIAYCRECGENPLVLGESELCENRRLICPDSACGFCCRTCRWEDQVEILEAPQ